MQRDSRILDYDPGRLTRSDIVAAAMGMIGNLAIQ